MPYTSLNEINRQRALSQQLRGDQDFNRASPLSGLAHVLKQWGAGRGEFLANEKEQGNIDLKNDALAQALSNPQGIDFSALASSGDPELSQLALQLKMQDQLQKQKLASGTNQPSNVQEWQYYNSLPDDQKQAYLTMKRADKVINLGDRQVIPNQLDPTQEVASYNVGLKPADLPENAAAKSAAMETAKQNAQIDAVLPKAEEEALAIAAKSEAEALAAAAKQAATVAGKAQGEAEVELADRESSLPRLEEVVSELSELGKKATYTRAGQATDTIKRELGMEVGEGAIARKEYISKVDNEILPLLRQTFGAQFTEREGQALKATLGDPNASPAEKDAVLKSFIETKRAQIKTVERKAGVESNTPDVDSLLDKYK